MPAHLYSDERFAGGVLFIQHPNAFAITETKRSAMKTPFASLFLAALLPVFTGSLRAEKIDFEKEILPILDASCFKCHSARAKKVKGETRLDDLTAIRARSRTDNLVFPHKPEKSTLFTRIALPEGDEDAMPPSDGGKRLSEEQIALIKKWIEEGAQFGEWKSATPKEKPVAIEEEAVNAADVAGVAKRIDELVEAGLAAKKAQPNPAASDEVWCRRVYLDLVGRIPTYDEITAFTKSSAPGKRAKLIDKLLGSSGHVSTMFNYWCDTLRARNRLADNVRGDFYLNYIKTSIRDNKPYDKWVRELVSPEGDLTEAPAVGFYLRDQGNRFASVDNTATIFLGTLIGCAQCHDHPYDKWTRKDYHQFAAWTSALSDKRVQAAERKMSDTELQGMAQKLKADSEKRTTSQRKEIERKLTVTAFEEISRKMMRRNNPYDFILSNGKTALGKLPADYQYPDGKPNEAIPPAVLFGAATGSAEQRPADTFAAWLTSPENERFALTIANRMWARIMGAPFAGPVETVRDVEDCANPALAAYLAKVMVAAKFDLRQFQRIVASTRTYGRQSGTLASTGADYDFPGPLLRRMSAEQAWDSMMTLAVENLDAKISYTAPDLAKEQEYDDVTSIDEIVEMAKEQAHEDAKDQMKLIRHPPRPDRKKKDPYAPAPEFGVLIRASELPQPAPEGHFLRTFGQSNREVADGAWRSGTVPQTLMLLNSTLFDALLRKGTPLQTAVQEGGSDSGRLHAAYLSILGRMPTMEDMRLISSTFNGTGNTMAIAHTLLGTRQFLFIQ